MPGKFTRSARAVIVDAVKRAHDEGGNETGEEHLLAALLGDPATQPLLGQVGRLPDPGAVVAEVRQARRRAGLSAVDADALAELGIDLDEVVSRVEAELGEGALDEGRYPTRRRWSASMSTRAKLVLLAAGRQATARGDRDVAVEHLLLGLLAQPGLVADTLGRRGVNVATVLAALDTRSPQAGATS